MDWEAVPDRVQRYPFTTKGWEVFVQFQPADNGWRCWVKRPGVIWGIERTFVAGGPEAEDDAKRAALALAEAQPKGGLR